jgi:hypothetical protein
MSATEFPVPGPNAGINSQIEFKRATPTVLRNSRILCLITLAGCFVAAFFVICMLLMVISLLFLQGGLNAGKAISAAQWGFGALVMASMCPWLWHLGRNMAGYRVTLDPRGVTFNLGTKKRPANLFLPWEQITAIKRRRVGNAQQFWVEAGNGREATFSSYTFFRPRKVARMIAERTGLTVENLK